MKIYLASDHGGWFLKENIQKYLEGKKYDVSDLGNLEFVKDDDYSDFVIPLAEKIAKDKKALGIVLGRSGNGEAIAANKVKGIRAAVATSVEMAKKAREHNNANILALGADYVNLEVAHAIVDTFLTTKFSNEDKYIQRLEKVAEYESARN